ncbi:MAG: hypothetical protein II730_08105 [Bacteroidales bacterium]|nr:hypothetical protein [Bacteroidales bacterium]
MKPFVRTSLIEALKIAVACPIILYLFDLAIKHVQPLGFYLGDGVVLFVVLFLFRLLMSLKNK